MILVSVASVAGTAFLWYTYFDIKYNLDNTKRPLLLESVRNETAFEWYSIIATVITVINILKFIFYNIMLSIYLQIIILILVVVMRKRVDFLADLFKETSKCLAHIPGLFLQPLLTFLVLLAFFIFWIFVVLCLATAYYPGKTGIISSPLEDGSLTTPITKLDNELKYENLSFKDVIKSKVLKNE